MGVSKMNNQSTDIKPLTPLEPITKSIKEINKKQPGIKERKKK
jgi:hypothetical protein